MKKPRPTGPGAFVLLFLSLVLFLAQADPGFSQEAETSENNDQESEDPFHQHSDVEEVIVTATPLGASRFNILQGTAVLSGEKLQEDMGGNIGETLDHLPGLSNSYFGPGAGRPIIRGLGGDRIRILIGGIGSIDASSTSPDHAVSADPLTAQSIEVIRGPATLLYGNNAVGGVVNIRDGRIPFELPASPVSGKARAQYGTNSDNTTFSAATDLMPSEDWVLHFEGSHRDSTDIKVPGFLRSTALRTQQPLGPGETEPFEVAPNTSVKTTNLSAGVSRFFPTGFAGIAISHLDNNYGLPLIPGFGEEEPIRIALDQLRFDFMSEIDDDFLIFRKAKLRFGYGDYEHQELEEEEIGTIFLNQGWEGRVELVQKQRDGLTGAMGFQVKRRSFEAIGEEAFVPPSTTTQTGLFVMEEFQRGPWSLQGGARLEIQKITAPLISISRSFTGISFSGGVSYTFQQGILIGLNAFRTERAPNAEELFSNGPHLATQAFEVGDPTLGEETATGFELSLRKRDGRLTGSFSFFYTSYKNFIFEAFTGDFEDGLRVAIFQARDARFFGAEAELAFALYEGPRYQINLETIIDFVNAAEKLTGTPLPRIPPLAVQVGAEVVSEHWDFRVETDFTTRQTRTAIMENITPSYTSVNLSLAYRPFGERKEVTLRFQARNLNNAEIRHHTSFLQDVLPAPGRTVLFAVQGGF